MKPASDEFFSRLKLNLYEKTLELMLDSCALGLEYVKIVGKCGDFVVHVYLHAVLQDLECTVRTIGIAIEVSKSHVVNELLLQLLKYSNTILEKDDVALLYIDPKYTLGVFYMVCKDDNLSWIGHSYYEAEEMHNFSMGE